MSQISRPFQIALVAIVALALVWLVFLHGHSSGESSSSTASSSAQPAKAAQPSASGSSGSSGSSGGSTPYHGSAPGVAGLTRAIAKARGAVAQSQREAKAEPGAAASQGSSSSGSQQSSKATSPSGSSAAKSSSGAAKSAPSTKSGSGEASSATSGAPAKEVAVQSELKAGRTVIVLFWSPRGSDDKAVHLELQLLALIDKKFGRKANKELAVHYALASEVGQFGSITRSLQILQTPTMLVISPSGNTKTITGLTDAYAIQQAISEARKAS